MTVDRRIKDIVEAKIRQNQFMGISIPVTFRVDGLPEQILECWNIEFVSKGRCRQAAASVANMNHLLTLIIRNIYTALCVLPCNSIHVYGNQSIEYSVSNPSNSDADMVHHHADIIHLMRSLRKHGSGFQLQCHLHEINWAMPESITNRDNASYIIHDPIYVNPQGDYIRIHCLYHRDPIASLTSRINPLNRPFTPMHLKLNRYAFQSMTKDGIDPQTSSCDPLHGPHLRPKRFSSLQLHHHAMLHESSSLSHHKVGEDKCSPSLPRNGINRLNSFLNLHKDHQSTRPINVGLDLNQRREATQSSQSSSLSSPPFGSPTHEIIPVPQSPIDHVSLSYEISRSPSSSRSCRGKASPSLDYQDNLHATINEQDDPLKVDYQDNLHATINEQDDPLKIEQKPTKSSKCGISPHRSESPSMPSLESIRATKSTGMREAEKPTTGCSLKTLIDPDRLESDRDQHDDKQSPEEKNADERIKKFIKSCQMYSAPWNKIKDEHPTVWSQKINELEYASNES